MSISELDPRKIITGKDSRIFVGIGDDLPTFLAEAASWTASLSFTNAEVQPLMSMVSVAVPASVSISITLEEIVVRDDVMLEPLITALRRGITPWFTRFPLWILAMLFAITALTPRYIGLMAACSREDPWP